MDARSPLAAGLLGGLCRPSAAGALYRKSTLLDHGASPSSPSLSISEEDPFILGGKAARRLTKKGVRGRPARWWMPVAWKATSCPATGAQAGHEDHGQCWWLAIIWS